VRLILEDGTAVITDVEGKFSIYGLSPRRHVLRVDERTLPPGAELIETGRRNAGDARSRFVDLTMGELHSASFAIRRTDAVVRAVLDRRAQGEVSGLVADSGTVMIGGTPTSTSVASGVAAMLGGGAATGPVAPGAVAGAPGVVAGAIAGTDSVRSAYRPLLATGVRTLGDGLRPSCCARLVACHRAANGHRLDVRLPQVGAARRRRERGAGDRARRRCARHAGVGARARSHSRRRSGRWLVEDLDPSEPGMQTMLGDSGAVFQLAAPTQAGDGRGAHRPATC
jgi:hypothetical protein